MDEGCFVVIDAFWGDAGKGITSAHLALRDGINIIAKAGVGPNAEHGFFVEETGPYYRLNQLPLGWFMNPETEIFIGSNVAVNPELLWKEIKRFKLNPARINIDFRCPVVTKEHIQREIDNSNMAGIGSTFSGSGACRSDFVLRKAKQAGDIEELRPFIVDVAMILSDRAQLQPVMVESSQGYQLSLSLSKDYPYTTSKNLTPMSAMDDIGVGWQHLKKVALVVKAVPSREGKGNMGKKEYDAKTITKNEWLERSSIEGLSAIGDVRRKAKLDFDLLWETARVVQPTEIILTFADHYDPEIKNKKHMSEITDKIYKLMNVIETTIASAMPTARDNPKVTMINTGKPFDCMISLTDDTHADKVAKAKEYVTEMVKGYKLE